MNREIRAAFPAALRWTYLNTAAVGPLPTVAVEAVAEQLSDVATRGSANILSWIDRRERVRGLVGEMLCADPGDIAFTRNTTDGFCALAAGMNWNAGDNIVSIASEFPANYYPWRTVQEDHGVELRLCPEREGHIDAEELCAMIDERTRLVTVSAIQYETGARADLERIAERARRHDALLAVDIIQAFGATPLDVEGMKIDAAAGASYKWLCAPEGVGIFYLSERARERVKPLSRGWSCVKDRWDFADRGQMSFDDTRSWETGMGGTALLCGLEASLRLLLSVGIEKIASHLRELSDFLCEIVPRGRYEIVSDRGDQRSQIVSFLPINGLSSKEVTKRLAHERITVSARGPLVRIAPHLFNNYDDIECLAACLP
ncbi:MAG: aminotransferase class V-fold PLP-dependent enzyme [Chloracidobacterium sp.]|nr:aminotransferase class V-fold PLP-dependent enzyme [Chloracidobacterium sp.]